MPTVSISTGFAKAVFRWEGVVNEHARPDANREECSAHSDAAWRLVKRSSRAFQLEGGIVDGGNCDEREEGVVAVAVSLLFGRGLSALTSSELDLGFESTVTCSARSPCPFDVVGDTEPVGTWRTGDSGEVANRFETAVRSSGPPLPSTLPPAELDPTPDLSGGETSGCTELASGSSSDHFFVHLLPWWSPPQNQQQ